MPIQPAQQPPGTDSAPCGASGPSSIAAGGGALVLLDEHGRVRHWSSSARFLFGRDSEAVEGHAVTCVIPFFAEPVDGLEGWCPRADGTRFRALLTRVASDEATRTATLIVVDVTARWERDERDRALRAELERSAAEIGRSVAYTIDVATRRVEVTEAFADLIGWTRGPVPRALDALLALVHPEDRPELERRLGHAIATGGSFAHEFRVTAHRGERWLHVVGKCIGNGGERLIGTGVEITERRRADLAQRTTEGTLHALLDATIDGIVIVDAQGRIELVNRTVSKMYGIPPDELAGRPWRTLVELPAEASPEPGVLHELTGRRADGSTFPLECGFSQVELEGRRLHIAVLRDVTDRRLLEGQLFDGSERLLRQVGQDLHDELGQLLTGTAFLAKGLSTNVLPDYREQATRMVDLVNQAIARVRSIARGLTLLHVEAQSLATVLGEVVAESGELLGVECPFEECDGIDADRRTIVHLGLIVREAITNAARHGRARRVLVRVARDGARNLLTIEDDGVGIRPDHPVDGLGLRSMRYRAQMIGGTLDVSARQSVGAPSRGTIVRCWW